MSCRGREATVNDADVLGRLLVHVNDLHVAAMPGFFRALDADDQTTAEVRAQILDPQNRVFVAERTDEPVEPIGYVLVAIRDMPPRPVLTPRRVAEIDTLVVGAPFRLQDVGRLLVERAHRWAVEQGVDQVQLSVLEFNRAATRFYERLGYATVWRTMYRSLRQEPR